MELPLDGPDQYELVRGELRKMSPPGFRQGVLFSWIAAKLLNHAETRNLGIVFASGGCRIESETDTVRAPHVGFVHRDRLPDRVSATALDLAPDLVVEVVSPTDRFDEVQAKIAGDWPPVFAWPFSSTPRARP